MLEHRIAAIEAAHDGIGIVNKDGKLVFMNKALLELYGIDPKQKDEFLHQPWENIFHENARWELYDVVLPYLDKYKHWRGVSPLERLDGKIIRAELSLTKLPDGGMIGTARDVSEKEEFGKEKKKLEAQLYQAQKMDAIGRLAGGIAHDFNNILAAMNGYAEFLREDLPEGSSERGFAENIIQAGRQARELVDQMLAISRQKQSAHETVDLVRVLRDTVSMLNASLPKYIELETDFQADATVIDGNETQISQMIMNL